MTIDIENIEVYAILNFLRDRAMDCLHSDSTWAQMREAYLKEAGESPDYQLTQEEAEQIVALVEGYE